MRVGEVEGERKAGEEENQSISRVVHVSYVYFAYFNMSLQERPIPTRTLFASVL